MDLWIASIIIRCMLNFDKNKLCLCLKYLVIFQGEIRLLLFVFLCSLLRRTLCDLYTLQSSSQVILKLSQSCDAYLNMYAVITRHIWKYKGLYSPGVSIEAGNMRIFAAYFLYLILFELLLSLLNQCLILNLMPECRKWHFQASRFQNFLGSMAISVQCSTS